ncbi:hypothetical protein DB31_8156 [Hyalangium minutum]|uniref:Uncharacterized protein n=1 Tax=Hyalangium minutum TaxID=394096 RepID=A0A085WJ10_9BACT|nr:hypothetical protein DB31_8156 [Hyalangium minutum]
MIRHDHVSGGPATVGVILRPTRSGRQPRILMTKESGLLHDIR